MVSVKDLQSIPFDLKHLWEVEILSPKVPELPKKGLGKGGQPISMFPITGYSDTIFSIESKVIDTPSGSISIPYKNNVGTLPFTLSFYDIVGGVYVQYFKTLVDIMFPSNSDRMTFALIPFVSSIYMTANVHKLDYDGKRLHTSTIFMYPEGELMDQGESEAGLHLYTLNFKKVG